MKKGSFFTQLQHISQDGNTVFAFADYIQRVQGLGNGSRICIVGVINNMDKILKPVDIHPAFYRGESFYPFSNTL